MIVITNYTFMVLQRQLSEIIQKRFGSGKAIILVGPRQVGKTTLIKAILGHQRYLFLNADEPKVRKRLNDVGTEELKSIIGQHQTIFIDEAQRIPNIGLTLKLITDQIPQVQLLVSGSSSLDLRSEINEPLTGRKWEYQLYPISWQELEEHIGLISAEQQLKNRLIFGGYPDVINQPGDEKEILAQLVDSYLYKDLLAHGNIRKPDILEKLVQALALQVGSEVNYNEIARLIGVDRNTVAEYISLLEKAFVVFSLHSFSRNHRNEIKKGLKIYFYDNGVINAITGNFNHFDLRPDKGGLWENFLVSERLKLLRYNQRRARMYFWRTTRQQEIDYLEEEAGKLRAFEFKWKPLKSVRFPLSFRNNYEAEYELIHSENFRKFLIES